MRGNFKVGGSLTGGLSFSGLTLESDGTLEKITVERVIPEYELQGLFKGELKALTIDGVHAQLRLDAKKKDEDTPPTDLKKLVETLRSVRTRVIPLKFDLRNISLNASKDGKPQIQLAPSSISHATGSDEISVNLGAITDPTGRVWDGRQSSIQWRPDDLTVDRIDPLPGVGVRGLVLQLPARGEPSADAMVLVDDAVFVVSTAPGFSAAKIDLREGKLQLDEAVKRFGIELPAKGTLTSLDVDVDQILPDPKAATGTVRLLLDNMVSGDWTVPTLSLDAELAAEQGTVAAHGTALGSGFSIDAAVPVSRQETRFLLGNVTGKFDVEDVPAVLRELAPRVPAIDPEAPVPASALGGNFVVSLSENKPGSADADLVLQPKDPQLASPIAVKGHWEPEKPVAADVVMDGLKASAAYEIEPQTYRGTLALDEFTNTRIDRWLAIVKVKAGGIANVSGRWNGTGEIKTGKHRGEVDFTQATWSREGADPITAIGGARYDWPAGFETRGLRVATGDQTVALEAALANGLLELRHFLWSNGADELAEGTASLPVPEDFAKWKDTLAGDTRPVAVTINSRVLSLGLLKQWVPAMEQLDPKSTGQLSIDVSGTYAEPEIDAKLEAINLRSPAQPKLPPANLLISLIGKEGKLEVNGRASAPDFAPALLKASMAFHPSEWANDPESMKEEKLDARVDLPRLDLSRFSSLVPMAEQVKGILTGNVVVTGELGKPEIRGKLDLAAAGIRFKDEKYPALESASAAVDLAMDRVVLKSLKGSVSGGTLQGDGSVAITEGKLGEINVRLQGNHLPVVRNDSLIVRANANLRLQGTWENSTLSGTVGVVDSIFFRDIEILPIGSPFTGPSAAALPKIDVPKTQTADLPEPFAKWGLNVTVRTEGPFLIRGNLATGEVAGSLKVGGTFAAPAPDGAFKVSNLEASLPFSTLSVRSGTVSFAPASGFDPILDIRGTAEPRPYQVTVYAYGLASNPQLVLTSNPPLPENEIMTLLATGTTTSGLEDPQAASSRALQLLAEELRRGRFRFGKQLRPVLALLDRVDFSLSDADPYSSESFSTATIELSDRWFISAGIGGSGDSRTLLIWRMRFR